ncbi:MAG: SUMF1/EgtB/PvdO family nonheme iron enzyme [Verrucomicrobia bacterium]|nr:SUMF1/EgtB/PvdO family nonheme iron enzyme [Verrucomicrobiota bacterium]
MQRCRLCWVPSRQRRQFCFAVCLMGVLLGHAQADSQAEAQPPAGMCYVPAGIFKPLFKTEGTQAVAHFYLDAYPVTNQEFLEFVRANPAWRRSAVKAIYADDSYLKHWAGDLDLGPSGEALTVSPVTYVPWFAARAFAAWTGKRLPTLAEWEMAASASELLPEGKDEQAFYQRILDWYGKPAPVPLPPVGSTFKNYWGLYDMHGLVWEWVEDFNSALVTGASRSDTGLDRKFFCGSGSVGASDFKDYAGFMRYAFRSSLGARFTVQNLGFRCAQDAAPETVALATAAVEPTALPGDSIYQLPAVWHSQDGENIRLSDFRGKARIVTMFFSHCGYACPIIMSDLKKIRDRLPPAVLDDLGFVLISFDSRRDSPPVLKAFSKRENLDLNRWTLLHGAAADVRTVGAALGVRYRDDGTGDISHANMITLLNADGQIVYQQKGLEADPVRMVEEIQKLLAK